MTEIETINLKIDHSSEAQSEEIKARKLSDGLYELISSPGFANGLAAGDRIRLFPERSDFEILQRGGNISVQVFLRSGLQLALDYFKYRLAEFSGWIDGRFDAQDAHLIVLTIPVTAGFPRIEKMIDEIPPAVQLDEWMYGNVYDEFGNPLNWWQGN